MPVWPEGKFMQGNDVLTRPCTKCCFSPLSDGGLLSAKGYTNKKDCYRGDIPVPLWAHFECKSLRWSSMSILLVWQALNLYIPRCLLKIIFCSLPASSKEALHTNLESTGCSGQTRLAHFSLAICICITMSVSVSNILVSLSTQRLTLPYSSDNRLILDWLFFFLWL